jgi:hypothetical protein
MLSSPKLRAIVNLLSDPLQAGAAANILAKEAHARGLLVADLISEASVSTATARQRRLNPRRRTPPLRGERWRMAPTPSVSALSLSAWSAK